MLAVCGLNRPAFHSSCLSLLSSLSICIHTFSSSSSPFFPTLHDLCSTSLLSLHHFSPFFSVYHGEQVAALLGKSAASVCVCACACVCCCPSICHSSVTFKVVTEFVLLFSCHHFICSLLPFPLCPSFPSVLPTSHSLFFSRTDSLSRFLICVLHQSFLTWPFSLIAFSCPTLPVILFSSL